MARSEGELLEELMKKVKELEQLLNQLRLLGGGLGIILVLYILLDILDVF